MRTKLLLLMCLLCPAVLHAAPARLTEGEMTRLKAAKQLVREVEQKSLDQSVKELERTSNPGLNLAMKEAMARTYADIVREQKVDTKRDKDWLYSMVTLNMAYLQFGGSANTDPLNKMICRKLKEYLTKDVLTHPDFHQSVE